MSTNLLTNILLCLLIANFIFWLFFLVFFLFKVKKILKKINQVVETMEFSSNTVVIPMLKLSSLAIGLIQGIKTVKSITTLRDTFDKDLGKEKNNERKQK